jgi:hypothetical protein
MPALPTEAIPAAEFLVRHLYRPITTAAGSSYFAITETENPGEDAWFWNDDNAKILELMSRPEIWQRFPRETAEIIRFVRSMCHGPFIFRRVSAPRLEPAGKEGSVTIYRHSLMQLKFDLQRGAVVAGVRFHDERSADNLMLSGNYIEFTYRGRRFKRPVETAISEIDAVQEGHQLHLRHSGEVSFTPYWQRRRLGRVAYTYIFDARSMLFEVEAALDLDGRIQVSDVVLTIGHDGLGYCFFNNIVADTSPNVMPLFRARKPAVSRIEAPGGTYYAIRQAHISGDALAIHSMPRYGQRLSGIEAVVETAGRFSRVIARYEFPGQQRGARLVAAEHKLITAGGFYDRIADYAGFMRAAAAANGAPQAAYDLSISYDYGVTINALSKCFAVCAAGISPEPASLAEELRSFVDQYLDYYFELYVDQHEQRPNAIFSRELAFVLLGVVTMYRATGSADYLRRLRRLCDVLLDFELRFDAAVGRPASAFLMRKDSPRRAFVDCHSAALLALTQATRYIRDDRLAATIERGLASYGLETCWIGGTVVDTVSALMVDEAGERRTENAFWNFKAGLTLRFFAALRQSSDPALQLVAARQRDRMQLLESIMRDQLERSVTERDGMVELRCSVISAETNSESQPWAMLGLVGHPWD